jgi:hypothetical protein
MATQPKGNYTVTDMYLQYLNRAPTQQELQYWNSQTAGGASAGIDPEEITSFLTQSAKAGENPSLFANVTSRPIAVRGEEGSYDPFLGSAYTPAAREGDKTFEGQKYFETDKQNILKQLQAQQAAGMKYKASFTQNEAEILDDLATRLAAQGVTNLADIKPIMSGETMQDTGEGKMERVESVQIGLYNSKTGEPLDAKMLTNNKGDGTTNYQAAFVNGLPVFTASQSATGLKKIQEDFGPILAIAASAILPGIPVGGTTLGNFLGTSLGLQGTAATAVGNALVASGGTFAATGSAEKAALAALMVGAGGYLKDTGKLGDLMDQTGLGDFKQTFGIQNTAQISGAGMGVPGGMLGAEGLVGEAGLGGTGLGDVVGGAGQSFSDAVRAAEAARFGTAGQAGFSGIDLSSNLAGGANAGTFGNVGTGGFGSALGSAADLAASLTNAGFSAGTAANLAGQTAAGTGATNLLGGATALGTGAGLAGAAGTAGGMLGAEGLVGEAGLGGTGLGAGTGAGAATGTGAGLGSSVGSSLGSSLGTSLGSGLLNSLLGGLTGSIPGLLGAGIDYARLAELQRQAEALGAAQAQRAEAFGQQAQVPFTPYTVTTGAGTSTVAPGSATAQASAAQQALRDQAFAQSLSTLQGINPAQAAQQLYGQIETLAAPGREREQLALQERLQRQGLMGFGSTLPTTGGGARTVNPLFESLLSAQETARAQQALQAQQFGTTEAGRLQQIAAGLQNQGMAVTAEERALLSSAMAAQQAEQANRVRNANTLLGAQMSGLALRSPYEQYGLLAQGQAINAAAGAASGLFGLPTAQGNTSSNWLANLINQGMQQGFNPSAVSSGLDISGNSQATQNLISQLQDAGIF